MKKNLLPLLALLLLLGGCTKREYTVRFELNGGTLVSGSAEQMVVPGGSAAAPEVIRRGYALAWDRDFTDIRENITVSAVWTEAAFTVTYDPAGGVLLSGTDELTVPAGAPAPEPEVWKGFRTARWEGIGDPVTADAVYTAVWEDAPVSETELSALRERSTVRLEIVTRSGVPVETAATVISPGGLVAVPARSLLLAESVTLRTADGRRFTDGAAAGWFYTDDAALLRFDTGGALPALFPSESNALPETEEPGEPGTPLTDELGDLAGVWGTGGTVISAAALRRCAFPAGEERPFREFARELREQTDASYAPKDARGQYHFSLLSPYQEVTGVNCLYSVVGESEYSGYRDSADNYIYAYRPEDYWNYVNYLLAEGYEPRGEERFESGSSSYYYSPRDSILVDMFLTSDESELWIWVTLE